jgi:hypothetical protein
LVHLAKRGKCLSICGGKIRPLTRKCAGGE